MEFRVADKVMQTRNNYELECSTGIRGSWSTWTGAAVIHGGLDGRLVAYSQAEAEDLVVAYATTIHKAQGSEYRPSSCRCIRSTPSCLHATSSIRRSPGANGW
jgi:exodeoxyribonuclease V alpha subunit